MSSITENVARVRAGIEAAALAAGRDPKEIRLIRRFNKLADKDFAEQKQNTETKQKQ